MIQFSRLPILESDGIPRRLTGLPALLVGGLALGFAVFVLLINSVLLVDILRRSAVLMGMLLALAFLLFPAWSGAPRDRPSWYDWILAAAGLATGLYIVFIYDDFISRHMRMTTADFWFGAVAIGLCLEAGRRCLGLWLSLLAVLFLCYALFGQAMPGPLAHFGVRPERLVLRLYMVSEGLFGATFQVAQTFIALFILFGTFLAATGTTEVLTRIGLAVSGRYAGGPAKVAAVASGITGMISGTAAANVATTGTMTIPMMKRVGFSAPFAGAVEAIASTGGLIMPPIMGAAAFLIADFVGVPYLTVMAAAVIPALLYYITLLGVIHLRSVKQGIRGLPAADIPGLGAVLLREGYLLIPIGILIYCLIIGYTPNFAAMVSIAATIVVALPKAATRLGPRRLLATLVRGGMAAVSVCIACLVAGIIVGVVSMTGVAQVFTSYIEVFSGGLLLAALGLTGVAAILMSCALPATAVYIVVAVTIAPALIGMGAEPLAAHFFVFWFGVLSNITPPVAIACFTAAGIAGAGAGQIGFLALRMALPAFAIAPILVFYPDLLLIDWTLAGLAITLVHTVAGLAAYVIATEGHLRRRVTWPERLALLAGCVLCLVGMHGAVGLAGLALVAALLLWLLRPPGWSATVRP